MNFSFAHWLLLQEGVYDPQAFKAVIVLGGPGTGKSYITEFFRGFKPVNSDSLFEKYLKGGKKIGAGNSGSGEPYAGPARTALTPSPNAPISQSMNTPSWSAEELPAGPNGERGYNLGQWKGPGAPPISRGIDVSLDPLQQRMKKRAGNYTNALAGIKAPGIAKPGDFQAGSADELDQEGERRSPQLGFEAHPFRGNPLILETTGQNLDSLNEDLPALKGLGYDVYGVMVNCLHIDSALRSNYERGREGRSLRDGLVVSIHRGVRKNLPELAAGYAENGSGFYKIDVDRIPPSDYKWMTDEELDAAINDPKRWAEIAAEHGLYDDTKKWKFTDAGSQIGRVVARIQRKPLMNDVGREWITNMRRQELEADKAGQVSDDPNRPTPGVPYDPSRQGPKKLPPYQGSRRGRGFNRPPV